MTSELKSMFGDNIPEQAGQLHQNSKRDLEKRKKEFLKNQTGLKREVIKLVGGIPSIVERTGNKGLKNSSNWVWSTFSNPARKDNLKLYHWQRAEDVNKDYDFAKFDQKIDIVEFTKEEYDKLIKPNDRNWDYEQTIYLWDLIKRYELRFSVILDRFDEEKYGERSVDILKDRYYSVARTILENRKMFDHPIIKSGYNYEQEMKRRAYLEKTMNKSFAELREENNLLEMAENLNKKMEKNEKFENALHKRLNELKVPSFGSSSKSNNIGNNTIQIPMNIEDTENNNNNGVMTDSNMSQNNRMNMGQFYYNNENSETFEDYIKNNVTRNDSFVYLRSQKLKHKLPVSEKIQERVDNYIKEFNIQQKLIPTARVEIAYDNLRNNIILYTSLKKFLEKKEKEYNFLQNKFKEYQNRKNPKNLQGNNNGPSFHPQISKSLKAERSSSQNKTNPKSSIQNEELENNNQEITSNKNINNIANISKLNNKTNNSQETNNVIKIDYSEKNNANDSNNTNNKSQEKGNPTGLKEKRKKISGTPKARKRKSDNDEEIQPTNEEKETKTISKKKKKGNK